MSQASSDYTVIGAGIIGACCAVALLQKGFSVTLIERDQPGEGASSGNAGSLGIASIPPTGMPGLARRVPRMLLDPKAPLIIRWRHLPSLAPWLVRLLRNSSGERLDRIADARAALLARVYDAYEPLLAAAGLQDVLRRNGRLFVYESDAAFTDRSLSRRIREQHGVRMTPMTGDQAREMEPELGSTIRSALYLHDVHQIANPLRLVQGLVRHFVASGGTLEQDEIRDFERDGNQVNVASGIKRSYQVKGVVLAAGAWSARLAERLGVALPLEAERGYNVSISNSNVRLRLPVSIVEKYLGVSPMEDGLRICGMAEFAGLETPPDYRRADVLLELAREVFPGLASDVPSTRWMGPRPSLPDSLPAIGRSALLRNVLFACGHDHLGITMGPITGRLIAAVATSNEPEIDLAPFSPDRFS